MITPIIVQSPKNPNHQLEEFFNLLSTYVDDGLPSDGNTNPQLKYLLPNGIEQQLDGFQPKLDTCGSVFDISRYIPLWVVHEKNDDPDKTNAISVFDFLQKYYDWLYCDSSSGAQYMLSENLLDLVDIEKTREEFYKRYIYTYINGLSENILVSNGGTVVPSAFVDFVKGIRREFYQRKTTINGIKYFFKVLFSVNEDDIYVYEPKRNILRLNGGKFISDKFKFSGVTGDYDNVNNLAGSYLNNARFHDNDWIHEYSYLLSVGITAAYYAQSYLDSVHPAGLRVVFERKISDYIAPTDDIITNGICEISVLKHYSAYRINTAYTTQIATGPDGSSLYGLTACGGCTGYGGFTGSTYFFPSWSPNINQTKFNDINIFDFFNMCLDSGITTPNENLSCANC